MVGEREDDWHVGAASRRPLMAFRRFQDGRRNTAPTTSDEAPSAMAARRLGKTPRLLLPSSCLLLATGLGLFFAALSPAFAGQTITIDGSSGGGSGVVSHDVYGNGTLPDGDAPTSNDPSTLTNPANGNTVNINSTMNGNVSGGANSGFTDSDRTASGNIVNINNGGLVSNGVVDGGYALYGGISTFGTATATGNSVVIKGGMVNLGVLIMGGSAYNSASGDSTATNNSVTISGGTISGGMTLGFISGGIAGGTIVGGYADCSGGANNITASNNSVIINGGTINSYVVTSFSSLITASWVGGGYAGGGFSGASASTASDNSVIINNGTINAPVVGGITVNANGSTAAAIRNSISISGGIVNGDVIGGYAAFSSENTATGNIVTISGNPVFDANATGLYGGYIDGVGDPYTGNILNLRSPITVASAQNFQVWNFYLPSTMTVSDTMLTVTGSADLGASATVNVGISGASSPLKAGDTVTLINAGTLTGSLANSSSKGEGMQGVTLLYGFDLNKDSNQLSATVTSVGANPQAKTISSAPAAALTTVNIAGNTASTTGVSQAVQAASAPDSAPTGTKADTEKVAVGGIVGVAQSSTNARPFGSISGGHMSYDTGSSVDVNSMALIAGLSRASDLTLGRLTLGGFFEGGYGRYNADSGAAGMTVHGDGNIENIGAGVLGRLDLAQFGEGIAAGRFYTDGSLRFGRVKSDFSSSDLRDMNGTVASFDTQAWYYGLHVGGGYLLGISDTSQADLYVRYLWSHQNGDDVTLSTGEEVNFDAVNSHRTVVGGRYTWVAKSWLVPYVGAAWEHEFDGKAGSSTHGMEIATSSLVGETGMGEVGVNIGSNEGRFAFDLGVQGYVGMREGVSGTFRLVYRW